MIEKVIIISIIAWWIAEGSFLVQNLKHYLNEPRIPVLDCAKCLGFWLGLLFFWLDSGDLLKALTGAILVSAGSILLSKKV